ncbi:MAG: aminotransferase class V-fold PLP-dependent enzyme [Chromatiaceae bacterium]|jgi:selenocysteine lyase/cysteine desulfurase
MHPEFPQAYDLIYLNHAAVSPWPKRTVDAVVCFAQENGARGAAEYGRWLRTEARLRERLATLINADSPADIALTKNTSEGLSIIGHGLGWQAGDNIVGIAQEFPSNRIVWESLSGEGVAYRQLDLYASERPEDDLMALCDRRTRLLAVSSVQYARGLRLDLERLGTFCRSEGILLSVDGIQSLGAVPFDLSGVQADFVVADGHKWMLGPEGIALLYVNPEVRPLLRLRQYGWHMVAHPGDFDRQGWEPAPDAKRFECGSANMLGIHALEASLSLLEDVGIAAIHRSVAELTERLVDLIDQQGFELLSPRDPDRRAGIVTFGVPGVDTTVLQPELMARGVICAHRGGGIRFSPHFYTPVEHLEHAMKITARLATGRRR